MNIFDVLDGKRVIVRGRWEDKYVEIWTPEGWDDLVCVCTGVIYPPKRYYWWGTHSTYNDKQGVHLLTTALYTAHQRMEASRKGIPYANRGMSPFVYQWLEYALISLPPDDFYLTLDFRNKKIIQREEYTA